MTQLTNIEMWEIIKQPYINTPNIYKLRGRGYKECQKINREITEECSNLKLPRYCVPTGKVLKVLGLNPSEIYQKAIKEIELNRKRGE